jgi:hypothetical protein
MGTMRIPSDPLYGKTIDLPLTLGKRAAVRIAVLAILPLLFLLAPALGRDGDSRLAMVRIGGFVLVPLCAYAAFSIYRASRWTDCRFRLTRHDVTIPLFPVYRRKSRTLALDDVVSVGIGSVGNHVALQLVDRNGTYKVPWDWFPPDWEVQYLAIRIQARAHQRQQGMRLDAKQLAVAEAALDHVDAPEMVMVHGPDDAPEVLVVGEDAPSARAAGGSDGAS